MSLFQFIYSYKVPHFPNWVCLSLVKGNKLIRTHHSNKEKQLLKTDANKLKYSKPSKTKLKEKLCCVWYIYWFTAMFSVLFCCFLVNCRYVFGSFRLFFCSFRFFLVQLLTYYVFCIFFIVFGIVAVVFSVVFGTFLLFSVQLLTYCNVFCTFLFFFSDDLL